MESRFQRDQKFTPNERGVNANWQIFTIFCQNAIGSGSTIYLSRQRQGWAIAMR
jgi:hypothetical protein